MIDLDIPGYQRLTLSHLVLDFNGTLARDGLLLEGVRKALGELADRLTIHVVSGDTYGTAQQQLQAIPCRIVTLGAEKQAEAKFQIVQELGAQATVAIGNGRNDAPMLKAAALGIGVSGEEGIAVETLTAANILVPHIFLGLDLLLQPTRLIATLRS